MTSMWWKKLALALCATVLSLGTVIAVLLATGILENSDIVGLRTRWRGSTPIGIWQSDPVLGWSHRPSSMGRHRHPTDFDVRYNIDSDGNRRVPEAGAGPEILFLGGSFTFGYGVTDGQAFPALVQRAFPDLKAVNAGAMAWGTVHAWLRLTTRLEEPEPPAMVVYGYIDHHRRRNWLRRSWLETLKRKNDFESPRVEIIDGILVWQGLTDPEVHGLPDSATVVEAENKITARLLEEMALRCRREGVPFLVVHLPDRSDVTGLQPLQATFDRLADEEAFVDLRPIGDDTRSRFANNNHLSPEGHRMVAARLEEIIRSRLRSVD